MGAASGPQRPPGTRVSTSSCRPPLQKNTPGFLIYDFLADRRSSILGVLAAPVGRETLQKVGGEAPHLFGGFPGRPGPPRPPKSTIPGRPKNHILRTQVHFLLSDGRKSVRCAAAPPATMPSRCLGQPADTSRACASTGRHRPGCTPGFLKYDFFGRPEIVDFVGLGGSRRPGNLPKRWGATPPTFLEGFPAARGRPDPQNRRFPVGQKIMY